MPTLARQLLEGKMLPGPEGPAGLALEEEKKKRGVSGFGDDIWEDPGGAPGGNRVRVSFGADSFQEGVDDSAVVFTIHNATLAAAWDISISSSGGGTPITDSGTVGARQFSTAAQDLTGLSPGTLTVTYSEDSVVKATSTALLIPPFEEGTFDSTQTLFDSTALTWDNAA